MDKLVEHAIRMLEIVEGENDFFRNDAKRQADIARAVYDTILRVQVLERKSDRKTEPTTEDCSTVPTSSKMEQVDEPITQTKTQNSNLTFEKRTMLDCYNCKYFCTENCRECHYEPKDEPTISKMEQVEDEPQTQEEELLKTFGFEPDCAWK